ncbi:conserved hypothetical protein [Psychromonas ingrahamii 37]|uniref:DUF2982 domain-containing protein n=1 Tax=Psychromonas ingrahamii (strain DSM 17664 / CCUG 51855 / 37) TaxID=357804 RepID=A1ST56_PSYIN|nr:DUF2982 domain-containing protein [Psychromonas ingrahamii]ABM02671.1 conserved hypothetical protein [Psychromonas ingrahamii 37]
MQKKAQRVIQVKPNSKHNRLFLLCLGSLLLCVCLLLNLVFWDDYRLPLIFIMSASFIMLFVALLKFLEPPISYFITPEIISYYHFNGHWHLPWQDILRIGDIPADIRGQHVKLPYLGIKLNSLANIAQTISPRLANKLLHEQLELLMLAVKNREIDLPEDLINFEPFELNGVTYKGPIAAWLYRTEELSKAYGYHLYLPINSFDRESMEFLGLLKECHHYINSYQGN